MCQVALNTYLGETSGGCISWTTIVVHSRDDQEVHMVQEVKLPKNQPLFSQMMTGQYWLGKTINPYNENALKKLPWNFNFF